MIAQFFVAVFSLSYLVTSARGFGLMMAEHNPDYWIRVRRHQKSSWFFVGSLFFAVVAIECMVRTSEVRRNQELFASHMAAVAAFVITSALMMTKFTGVKSESHFSLWFINASAAVLMVTSGLMLISHF